MEGGGNGEDHANASAGASASASASAGIGVAAGAGGVGIDGSLGGVKGEGGLIVNTMKSPHVAVSLEKMSVSIPPISTASDLQTSVPSSALTIDPLATHTHISSTHTTPTHTTPIHTPVTSTSTLSPRHSEVSTTAAATPATANQPSRFRPSIRSSIFPHAFMTKDQPKDKNIITNTTTTKKNHSSTPTTPTSRTNNNNNNNNNHTNHNNTIVSRTIWGRQIDISVPHAPALLYNLQRSSAFRTFEIMTCQLQKVSLYGLHTNELAIFFCNVYNTLFLHAMVIRAAQVRQQQLHQIKMAQGYQAGLSGNEIHHSNP